MPDMPRSGAEAGNSSVMRDRRQEYFSGYRIEREDTSANP